MTHHTEAVAPVTGRPLVQVTRLGKRYGSRHVLSGVDLTIHPGEVVGLVGPNGAGKTTLIRILTGMSRPTEGGGRVLEARLGEVSGRLPFVGLMIERPSFIESLSARRNLELLFGIRGQAGTAEAERALRRVGLDPHERKPVRSYSLGMRQRLSLAQAIGESPALAVLDEPTNGLDPAGIVEMRLLVRRLADEDRMGVLLASHLLSEVEAVCDRVIILKGGEVQHTYTPSREQRDHVIVLEVGGPDDLERVTRIAELRVQRAVSGLRVEISCDTGVPGAARALVAAGVEIESLYRDRAGLERAYLDAVEDRS